MPSNQFCLAMFPAEWSDLIVITAILHMLHWNILHERTHSQTTQKKTEYHHNWETIIQINSKIHTVGKDCTDTFKSASENSVHFSFIYVTKSQQQALQGRICRNWLEVKVEVWQIYRDVRYVKENMKGCPHSDTTTLSRIAWIVLLKVRVDPFINTRI